jgi:hypothetical protein
MASRPIVAGIRRSPISASLVFAANTRRRYFRASFRRANSLAEKTRHVCTSEIAVAERSSPIFTVQRAPPKSARPFVRRKVPRGCVSALSHEVRSRRNDRRGLEAAKTTPCSRSVAAFPGEMTSAGRGEAPIRCETAAAEISDATSRCNRRSPKSASVFSA